MPFYQYLKISTVIDLKSDEKEEALRELAQVLCKIEGIKKQKPVIDDILKREETASTFIGQGVAIPYATGPIQDSFAIVVGRSLRGIPYDAARNAQARIIVLVIAKKLEDASGVELRQEIASFFKSEMAQEKLSSPEGVIDILDLISSYKKRTSRLAISRKTGASKKQTSPIISSAISLAKDLKATALVFLADAVEENDFLNIVKTNKRIIVITSNKSRFDKNDKRFSDIVHAPYFPGSRTGQIKIGILLALSRSLIKKDDRLVCITGNSYTGVFDTIITLDVEKEFQFFLAETRTLLPPDVKPEVLERVLGLASEIAIEGREGKPTGTIFVLGDTNSVNAFISQLIINPFRGYSEAERNILDPGLDETIKEFAGIDGAFIITGDGIVLSAGTYLRPPSEHYESVTLPSGFGARHISSAAITTCTNALAITISESTGMVSIFKNGVIMLSIAKPVNRKNLTRQQPAAPIDLDH